MQKTQHTKKYALILIELKRARKNAGLTQRDVARLLNKHAPFVSKIESGERRLDIIELHELCQIYKIKTVPFLKRIGIT